MTVALRYVLGEYVRTQLQGYTLTAEDRAILDETVALISGDSSLGQVMENISDDLVPMLLENLLELVFPVIGQVKYGLEDLAWPVIRNMLGDELAGVVGSYQQNSLVSASPEMPVAENGNLPYNQNRFSGSGKEVVSDPFDENGHLLPNVEYVTGEYDYHYETDSLGRIARVFTGSLHLTSREKRLRNASAVPGKQLGDDAGHLIGDRFGGSNKLDNLIAQLRHKNRGAYNVLEKTWADAIRAGSNVSLNIELQYEGDNPRPTGLLVIYSIDGESNKMYFNN